VVVITAIVMSCTALAAIFIWLPINEIKGLKTYRISLRILAIAYINMATLKILVMKFDVPLIDLV